MTDKVKKVISIDNIYDASLIYGNHDKYLRLIRDEFAVDITARNGTILIEGEKGDVKMASEVFSILINRVKLSDELKKEDVSRIIADVKEAAATTHVGQTLTPAPHYPTSSLANGSGNLPSPSIHPVNSVKDGIIEQQGVNVFLKDVIIRPKTIGQARYVEAIKKNDVVFCIGPAGTGKTYLAVALAVSALRNEAVKKVVLARPAVEAGERLGFLPGDIQAKVNPYLRPLYDALADMMEPIQVKKFIENDLIEILPLAFMRGRTMSNSFVILDEAQNCTIKQMKTFLTRLGLQSRVVITGDITQIDLPSGEVSGLIDSQKRLINVPGIAFVYLDKRDIVRHKLVQDIVDAYEIKE